MNIHALVPSNVLAIARGFALALCIGMGTASFGAEPPKLPPLPIDEMRAVAYIKEFAKRFGLPNPEPGRERRWI